MEILIAAVVLAAGLVGAAPLLGRGRAVPADGPRVAPVPKAEPARARAEAPPAPAQLSELERRERGLADRERQLELERDRLAQRSGQLERELERVSGMSAAQAKAVLLRELEDDSRHARAK